MGGGGFGQMLTLADKYLGGGVWKMLTFVKKGERGVWNPPIFADIICEQLLTCTVFVCANLPFTGECQDSQDRATRRPED